VQPRFPAKVLLFLSFLCLVSGPVEANPMDTFGYGSRAIGMGGAATATADSYEACYYNPAGLARLAGKGPELGLGVLMYRPFLKVNGRDSEANRTRVLYDVGIASPIPFGKGVWDMLFLGINVQIPGARVYSIRARAPNEPHFPFLEDTNRRLVLNVAAALRLWKNVAIGAGFSMLPDVYGVLRVDDPSTSVDVDLNLSPNVGLLIEPIGEMVIGITWRGANRSFISVVSMDPDLQVDAYDYSTPHEIALGVAGKVGPVVLSGDFTYYFYRYFKQSKATTGANGSNAPGLSDAVAVRLGAEWRVIDAVQLRAGFSWIQSPVPAQEGETNLLDGDRYTGSLGLGFDAAAIGGPPIQLDAHVAWSYMTANNDAKTDFNPDNPGFPSISSSGSILNAGLTAKVSF